MKYGLEERELEAICGLMRCFPKVERAILCGSRAKGTYHQFSDIDLSLAGEELNDADLEQIRTAAASLQLPYEFDIFLYREVADSGTATHRARAIIYEKQ